MGKLKSLFRHDRPKRLRTKTKKFYENTKLHRQIAHGERSMKIRTYTNRYGETREEMILTREEQEEWYRRCINRVLQNTREVLDHLEYLPEFKVNWQDYHAKKVKKQKDL